MFSIYIPSRIPINPCVQAVLFLPSFYSHRLPLNVDSFLSHKSLSIVPDLCIAASGEVHYIRLYHIVSVSVYSVLWFCSLVAFFFTSPSALFWVFALQLLVEKSITFDYATVYMSLWTMFWFCSFLSASIPGGHSRSHGINLVHYSFEHNSIPSPADTTICSAIPNWRASLCFPFFCHHKTISICNY